MEKELLDRINFLAKKKREEGLTEEEAAERKELHAIYLKRFRENFRAQLECIKFVDELPSSEKERLPN